MRSSRLSVTRVAGAMLAVMLAAPPLLAQSKGKSGGNDDAKNRGARGAQTQGDRGNVGRAKAMRSESRGQPPRNTPQSERGAARGRGVQEHERGGTPVPRANDRGNARAGENAARRAARSDERIQRRVEREFAGDVALSRGDGWRGRVVRPVSVDDLRPSLRRFYEADRGPARVAAGAVARAHLRGLGESELVIRPVDDRVRIVNHAGLLLVDLDEARARELGRWEVVPVGNAAQGAPAFCRSGEGHPVFGRQWCIDKRFGLGTANGFRWGRTERIQDLVLGQPVTAGTLARDALLSLLGPVAFNRLALHAITLGLADPLVGRWIVPNEPGEPRLLVVSSGDTRLAEIVDADRDNRADLIVVALRDW